MKKFILGMLSVILFIPICESLSDILCGCLEIAKIFVSKKILKGNNELTEFQEKLEPISTQCMGFQIPSDTDEEEWEEDVSKNKLRKK